MTTTRLLSMISPFVVAIDALAYPYPTFACLSCRAELVDHRREREPLAHDGADILGAKKWLAAYSRVLAARRLGGMAHHPDPRVAFGLRAMVIAG